MEEGYFATVDGDNDGRVGWLNIYKNGDVCAHPTQDKADCAANYDTNSDRIACVQIEFRVGQNLYKEVENKQ